MKYIKFKHFRSERSIDSGETERLRKLKAELKRVKRQRIVLIAIAIAATTLLTALTFHLLTNDSNKNQTNAQPRAGNSEIRK